jgi:hypothetical protein
MSEDKRNREINKDRGMAVARIKTSSDWHFIHQIKQDLINDLHNGLFIQATEGKPLYSEVTYGQIMAHRHGVIEGVKQFFTLLDSYESVYLKEKGENNE